MVLQLRPNSRSNWWFILIQCRQSNAWPLSGIFRLDKRTPEIRLRTCVILKHISAVRSIASIFAVPHELVILVRKNCEWITNKGSPLPKSRAASRQLIETQQSHSQQSHRQRQSQQHNKPTDTTQQSMSSAIHIGFGYWLCRSDESYGLPILKCRLYVVHTYSNRAAEHVVQCAIPISTHTIQ